MKIVGLVPCAGKAERLGGIPKYLLPLTGGSYLLAEVCRKLTAAGASPVYIGAGTHNQAVLNNYAPANSIVYRINNSRSMTETLAESRQHIDHDATVLMLMSDVYFEDENVLVNMLADIAAGADVAVGVWPVRLAQRAKLGMCDIDRDWKLQRVDDKPTTTDLRHAWGAIAWKPSFWKHLQGDTPHLSAALNSAVKAKLDVHCSIALDDYWDLGTFDELTAFYASMSKAVTA